MKNRKITKQLNGMALSGKDPGTAETTITNAPSSNKTLLIILASGVAAVIAFFAFKGKKITVNENWKLLDSRNRTDDQLLNNANGLLKMFKYYYNRTLSDSDLDQLMMQFLTLEKKSTSQNALATIENPFIKETNKPSWGDQNGYYF